MQGWPRALEQAGWFWVSEVIVVRDEWALEQELKKVLVQVVKGKLWTVQV